MVVRLHDPTLLVPVIEAIFLKPPVAGGEHLEPAAAQKLPHLLDARFDGLIRQRDVESESAIERDGLLGVVLRHDEAGGIAHARNPWAARRDREGMDTRLGVLPFIRVV